jgi:hypothetical protein
MHIDADLSFPQGERRAQAVKLIDGTTYFHDSAYTDTDREATINAEITLSQARILDEWLRNRTEIYFDDDIGIYKAVIKALDTSNGNLSMTLYIIDTFLIWSEFEYPSIYVPPAGGWVEKTSDVYWTSTDGVWDTNAWTNSVSKSSQFLLTPTGGWESGFRPTKIRLTYSPYIPNDFAPIELIAASEKLNPDVDEYESLTEVPITFDGQDITRIYMIPINAEPIQVTNIEFYDSGWASIFDNTKWEIGVPGYGIWAIDHWELDTQEYIHLVPKAGETWHVGYRPTKFRITFTLTHYLDLSAGLADTDYNGIVADSHVNSVEELTSDWSNNLDLFNLNLFAWGLPDYFRVGKIEFYEET